MLSTFEYKCYNISNAIAPDLVIKLIGEVDLLSSRREEMTIAEIKKNQDGIKAIHLKNQFKFLNSTHRLDRDILTNTIFIRYYF